jgi:hypothetical protein
MNDPLTFRKTQRARKLLVLVGLIAFIYGMVLATALLKRL